MELCSSYRTEKTKQDTFENRNSELNRKSTPKICLADNIIGIKCLSLCGGKWNLRKNLASLENMALGSHHNLFHVHSRFFIRGIKEMINSIEHIVNPVDVPVILKTFRVPAHSYAPSINWMREVIFQFLDEFGFITMVIKDYILAIFEIMGYGRIHVINEDQRLACN